MDNAGAPTPTEPSGAASAVETNIGGDVQQPKLATYPPYTVVTPGPPSVADTIMAGNKIRVQHKSVIRKPAKPSPKPARPRGPKATDVKMTADQTRRHLTCMRRHGAILTDRLERMSKPRRRAIIYLWREKADILPAETIGRLRTLLDADEPFKPDQAYEYFINLRKTKKKVAAMRGVNKVKKDLIAVCAGKKFTWARNATVAFARGIQQRLSRRGNYALADEMLRLSNIVLEELCDYTHVRVPSRRCTHPKAKFMMELSDKIAVWIDEILSESEDRMLMMDFDEDAEVLDAGDSDDDFADDFLNMMSGGGRFQGPKPAYLQFGPETLEAFNMLTDKMYQKSNETLYQHGRNSQTYKGGADQLKATQSFKATHFDSGLGKDIRSKLQNLTAADTPEHLKKEMKNVIDTCSNYLSSQGEKGKHKGQAFKLLTKTLRGQPQEVAYDDKGRRKTFQQTADMLEKASSIEVEHYDEDTTPHVHTKLASATEKVTPDELKPEMKDTVDVSAKFLSKTVRDEAERGPAFKLLVSELRRQGGGDFTPENPHFASRFAAAHALETAPSLKALPVDQNTKTRFQNALHIAMDAETPNAMKSEMAATIERCAEYLSGLNRDRARTLDLLVETMKKKGNEQLSKRDAFELSYNKAAQEIVDSPVLVSYLPVKDVADEIKGKLTSDLAAVTPEDLKTQMKIAISDGANLLSQVVALNSGCAGDRYAVDLLSGVEQSMGNESLVKHKKMGHTFADAAKTIDYAGALKFNPKSTHELSQKIKEKIETAATTRVSPGINTNLKGAIEESAKHLSKVADEKGDALTHLVDTMQVKADENLGNLQGYQQTYSDAARRIEEAPTLTTEKVDKGAYENVRKKLNTLNKEAPHADPKVQDHIMPGVVEEAAKFLAAPKAETLGEKRQVLADIVGRKGEDVLWKESEYQMSHLKGAQELVKSPAGKKQAMDPEKQKAMEEKLAACVEDKQMLEVLKEPLIEGAAHLTDLVDTKGAGVPWDGPLGKAGGGGAGGGGAGGPLLGPNGQPLLGPNGERILIGPDGVAYYIGADGKPVYVGADGKPLSEGKPLLGPDGKAVLGPNGEKILVGPDGRPYYIGADGKPVYVGADGKPVKDFLGPNGQPLLGPNGERILVGPDGKPYYIGPDGKPVYVGADGKPMAPGSPMLGADGKPMLGPNGERILIGADGKPYYIGADGKPVYVGADGKPLSPSKAMLGPDGKPLSVGADGKPMGAGKALLGPDGKPLLGPNGSPIVIGPDGKPYYIGPDGKKMLVGKDGKPILGPNGQPVIVGADGRTYYLGPNGEMILCGADGKPILGPNGETILIGPDGRPYYIGPDGKPVYVEGAGDGAAGEGRRRRAARGSQLDQELARATELMHRAMLLKGAEVFYKQPTAQLTHDQAVECLQREETRLEKSVRGCSDTIRLAKKFEKKLKHIVDPTTPGYLRDVMQDVIIEAAAKLAGIFVTKAYMEVAKDGLIQEMQRQGNKILIELGGETETFFFAAQRLKVDKLPIDMENVNPHVAHYLTAKMDGVIKCRTMPRKLLGSTRDHIREAANFLSGLVTKPDARIEAYVSLINEMEGAGDTLLINKEIQKSYKDAAAYLRELTSPKDQINKPDASLNSEIQGKLKGIMSHVDSKGYTASDLNGVIDEVTTLLVSYIVLEGERTKVLKSIIEEMKLAGDNVLLRHGTVRKSYNDAVEILQGKNTDQMAVQQVDPIIARKIQTKLDTVMEGKRSYEPLILSDVIQCAADYLAVNLLVSQTIKVCQCMKNEFVQCELWTDEILRRVTRPCCSCSRHVSTQALSELPEVNTRLTRKGTHRMEGPGKDVSLAPCPAQTHTHRPTSPCPAPQQKKSCPSNYQSYLMYSSTHAMHRTPPPMPPPPPPHSTPPDSSINSDDFCTSLSDFASNVVMYGSYCTDELTDTSSSPMSYHTPDNTTRKEEDVKYTWQDEKSVYSVLLDSHPFMHFTAPDKKESPMQSTSHMARNVDQSRKTRIDHTRKKDLPQSSFKSSNQYSPSSTSQTNEAFSASGFYRNKPGGPIVSTDQMSDWHAMIVSLMWNVQAWREWIQENVDTALNQDEANGEKVLKWDKYQKRVTVEAIQWRQYNIFSQQLTMRLSIRYRDKEIVSPTRATVKTQVYQECQHEMIKIIEMFNRWTRWLLVVVKETNSIKLPVGNSDQFRWNHFKEKILTYADDWRKYNLHLKVSWEDKYRSIVSEWLPSWQWSGPVWVVSACGAVPSGAVSAGVYDGEVIWVARTTHKNNVLPAALHPSKHCCLVYDEGSVYYYNKYQVYRYCHGSGGSGHVVAHQTRENLATFGFHTNTTFLLTSPPAYHKLSPLITYSRTI